MHMARLLAFLCLWLRAYTAASPTQPSTQPHILFILADDYGYNDVGYHQNAVSGANPAGLPTTSAAAGIMRTPTIDRLASQGVKLDSYYTQPLCSPTRSTIMTGRYPHHTGIGPDVVEIDHPYGVPADETFLPQVLRNAGYATSAIGKWHLGSCHESYLPTERGFESFAGYLAGGESYYEHAADFRNGTNASALGAANACVGSRLDGQYSAGLYASEAARVVGVHAAKPGDQPLFMYVAMQSVHNPYDLPPFDVNESYPEIENYQRRIYAGMVAELDQAVENITAAFKRHGLWNRTLLVFSTDNGGIGAGNNYPLRGSKVNMWEGGMRGVGFVRGTDDAIARLPAGTTSHRMMHTSDWLPTLATVAGIADLQSRVAHLLDGVDQWQVLQSGGSAPAARTEIMHGVVSAQARAVKLASGDWSMGSCLDAVDPSIVGGCHAFGAIGGAIRVGDFKFLLSGTNSSTGGLESSVPVGIPQHTPPAFKPTTHDTVPTPVEGVWLFNITADPTETTNLASDPAYSTVLAQMRARYRAEATSPSTRLNLGWIFGFLDPARSSHPQGGKCMGPFVHSAYCTYGIEGGCFVKGTGFRGADVGAVVVSSAAKCQAACVGVQACDGFVWRSGDGGCHMKASLDRNTSWACEDCFYGPRTCPR